MVSGCSRLFIRLKASQYLSGWLLRVLLCCSLETFSRTSRNAGLWHPPLNWWSALFICILKYELYIDTTRLSLQLCCRYSTQTAVCLFLIQCFCLVWLMFSLGLSKFKRSAISGKKFRRAFCCILRVKFNLTGTAGLTEPQPQKSPTLVKLSRNSSISM